MTGDKDRLHILLLLESHYPSSGGGAEGQVRTLARAFRARGHLVTIITPRSPRHSLPKVSRVDGSVVCRIGYPSIRLLGGSILFTRLALFLVGRRRRYCAWHVHIAHHMGPIATLLGRAFSVPVLVKIAGSWEARHYFSDQPTLFARLAFRCLAQAQGLQAISTRIAAKLLAKGVPEDRVVAIPNAVDTKRFRDIRPSKSSATRFLFLGRLVEQKGLDTLLDAFAESVVDNPAVLLRIVGTGPLEQMLQRRASSLGLDARVVFDGYRSDIEALLADADFAVLPSRIEGLSNTLLECMSAGLPALASRVSGSEDLVRHRINGWLFEPDDRAGLALALREACQLPRERRLAMGQCARVTVEAHAGIDAVIDQLLARYRRGANGSHRQVRDRPQET